MGLMNRLMHAAWNAFQPENADNVEKTPTSTYSYGVASNTRPDRPRIRINSERTIIASIYTRLAVDASASRIEHCRVDDNGVYIETMKSGLNRCLLTKPNLDQSPRHLRRDIFLTVLSEGVAAVVPVQSEFNPITTGLLGEIRELRVGTIVDWRPQSVLVRLYDGRDGQSKDIWLPKSMVAIIENPFYSVMNEPNSTLKRLVHKLSLLDNVDEVSSSGKLDLIIQLPYTVKSETRKNQARTRIEDLQDQLQGSTYGIAYADATEKITQLNRSVENNLLEQIRYLKAELYNELGLTEKVMNGTADDTEMMNYMDRTIEPLLDAVTEPMVPAWLTNTAITQGQSIQYFQDPFKLIPISQLADLVDVLSRNQIITPNEVRPALGLKPSKEPQANQLLNSNMPIDKQVTSDNSNSQNITVEQIPNREPLALPAGSSQAEIDERRLDRQMQELGIT